MVASNADQFEMKSREDRRSGNSISLQAESSISYTELQVAQQVPVGGGTPEFGYNQ